MKTFLTAAATAGALAAAPAALATNLVVNGNFAANAGQGQIGADTTLTGWSVPTPGFTFLFAAATADTSGVDGVVLWGPGQGVANGFAEAAPGGQFFVGGDGYYDSEPIEQTIDGLIPGQTYVVSFFWAAAQQDCCTGASDNSWTVGFGAQTQQTTSVNIPSRGFSGWMAQTLDFQAGSASEVLSFLASGAPGVPPFALLSGVSVTPLPEPLTWTLAIAGAFGVGAALRRRRAAAAA